ncbi:unnamed protein product [Adineta steineri]|uniref:Beta-sarcoglycan n=1 Tax=Adineta steineri TaxID=433720 RepID=A0A813Y0W1_9BILA|nr:unnamed protein product [Adineta steineri]CAF1180212.1 unnamed protein product [Adineta steineri]CAF1235166.1 unnamed protein product [Adineta steineri]
MDLCRSDGRRRLSVTLDAGYVSVAQNDICLTSKIAGLHGKKLICVTYGIIVLFLISFINLICLLWFIYKLNLSLFDINGSKIFQFDKISQQMTFYRRVTCKEPVYITKANHTSQIDLLTDKQMDICGEQNSILFDDDQILLNTDNLYFKNNISIDFTNVHAYKFDNNIETRVHLSQLNSEYIHHKHMNITATNQLTLSSAKHIFSKSQNLILQTSSYNRRSVLRFNNHPNTLKKTSRGNLHFKTNSIYFDLPRFGLLANNHRSESGVYRICICNTTFLFLRSVAQQPCPLC